MQVKPLGKQLEDRRLDPAGCNSTGITLGNRLPRPTRLRLGEREPTSATGEPVSW